MQLDLGGIWITFQAGFTEAFIASSVVASVALTRGRKNALIGSVMGLFASGLLAFILQKFLLKVPDAILHWVSSILLLGFGIFLIFEFVKAQKLGEEIPEFKKVTSNSNTKINLAAITVAAWGVFMEGLEILIV